ncbi:MAG: addiction module protein [Verrucomicrobiales bacterium]
MTETLENLAALPVPERIQLVEDLWDTLVAEDADISIPEMQMAEIERRKAEMEADPAIGISWKDAKAQLVKNQP